MIKRDNEGEDTHIEENVKKEKKKNKKKQINIEKVFNDIYFSNDLVKIIIFQNYCSHWFGL